MLKKIIKISFTTILFIISIFFFFIFFTGPDFPPHIDKIIKKAITSNLPEQVKGKSGYVNSNDIKIWYEFIKPDGAAKGNILLIMGISNDAIAWPDYFIESLLKNSYNVIRFDNRGTGMSDWIPDWKNRKYTLDDMSSDSISIMDKLGIRKFHVVAASLGGMIGQQIAILYPERVLSLASLMSSGFITDPESPRMNMFTVFQLVKVSIKYGIIKSEINTIKLHLAARTILRKEKLPLEAIKDISQKVLYNLRKRKGYNPDASPQHQAAVMASGSRYEELKKLKVPTVIIHGKSDPLIDVKHGIKCAQLIPGSDSLFIENMGHDIPFKYNSLIIDNIIDNINRSKK